MANQVTDNRVDQDDGTVATSWEDIAGAGLAVDTEIAYDTFSGSIGQYATTTRDATIYNNGGTGLFASGDHAYILVNCGVVSLLDIKVNGGLTVRVTGATITDWAEFELFGSDDWPTAFAGGWVQIVVDIDELLANPTNTNGTPPTVANIQRFGVTFVTATVMPRMADNVWVGGFRILGANTPALIVEGRDGGSIDWNLGSVAVVAAVQLSAVLLPGPGGSFVCRGPIQFGINDTSTHAFSETNKTLLWDSQEVMLGGFYGLSALGNSGGTTDVTFGLKTGTGDDATGAQGGQIQAESGFARWGMDFDDPDLDGVNFYGINMIHGGTFQLDDVAVDIATVFMIDCDKVHLSNSNTIRLNVVAPNTADGVAFCDTDDMGDLAYCTFEFSDGHAIEILAGGPQAQDCRGHSFLGSYGAIGTNDAEVYNNSAALRDINVSAGGNSPAYRNGTSATTTVNNAVTLRVTVSDEDNVPIQGAYVIMVASETVGTITTGDTLLEGDTNASGVVEDTGFNYEAAFDPSGLDYDLVVAKGSEEPTYVRQDLAGSIVADELVNIIMQPD